MIKCFRFVIFIIVLVFFSQVGFCKTDENLEVCVETFQDTFVLGEPVLVEIFLRNNGTEDIKLHLDFTEDFVTVRVISPYGEKCHLTPGTSLYSLTPHHLFDTLSPGQEFSMYSNVLASALEQLFPEVGEYQIYATYKIKTESDVIWTGTLRSKEISVTVTEPNEVDKLALPMFEPWSIKIAGTGYQIPFDRTARTASGINIDDLESLVKMYPQSTYTKYAKFWLARYVYQYKGAVKMWKSANNPEGIAMYKKILSDYPEFSYTRLIKYHLAVALFDNKFYDESIGLLEEIDSRGELRTRYDMMSSTLWLAAAYFESGDRDTATLVFQEILERQETIPRNLWPMLEALGLAEQDRGYRMEHSSEPKKDKPGKKGCLFPF